MEDTFIAKKGFELGKCLQKVTVFALTVVIDEASADETVDEDDSDDQILNLDDSDIRPLIPDSQLANS